MPKLRVLALHSFRTSGEILREQLRRARLDEALDDLIELVFVDAPHPAGGPIPEDVRDAFPDDKYPNKYEWYEVRKRGPSEVAFEFANLEESEAYLNQFVVSRGPFDGVMGFSQGGMMAACLVAYQKAGMCLQTVPPFKFALLFGSAMPGNPRALEAMQDKVEVPSCHIIGHHDYIKQHSIELVQRFRTPVVILHNRGHVIPKLQGYSLAVLRAFLESFRDGYATAGQPASKL